VRGVSQTPTYDQLRGERINADVPASEDDALWVDKPGRHHPSDGAPDALAHGQSPKAAAHPTAAWSWFESADARPPGKHHLWCDAPDSAEMPGPSAGPRAHESRLGAAEPRTAGSVHATRRDEAGTRLHGETPSAVGRGGCNPGTPSPPGPQAAVIPPVAHARHTPLHGGKSSPAPAVVDNPKQDTAVSGLGGHTRPENRSLGHTDARCPMPKAVH
jgi:hypothetical protein